MTEDLVREKVEVLGTVQKVGYRDRVRRTARSLGVVGWVENDLEDEDRVVVEAQGSKADVEKFLQTIRGSEGLTDARTVTRLEALAIDPALKRFIIRRNPDRQEEMAERLDEAALYAGVIMVTGKETLRAVQEGNLNLGAKMDRSIESTERLHKDFTVRFDRVDASYGMIGKTLARMDKNLERLTKAILALAKESHRTSPSTLKKPRPASRSRARKHSS